MSRIHEALKRAEIERAAQTGDRTPLVEQQVGTVVQDGDTVPAIATAGPIDFEETLRPVARGRSGT